MEALLEQLAQCEAEKSAAAASEAFEKAAHCAKEITRLRAAQQQLERLAQLKSEALSIENYAAAEEAKNASSSVRCDLIWSFACRSREHIIAAVS